MNFDYILAKQDLETYNPRDIDLLAKYYDLYNKNHNDLLWLLTLKIHGNHRAHMPPISDLEALPIEMLVNTAIHFDWPTITKVCQTSKTLNEKICDNDDFWRRFIQNKAPGFVKSKYSTWPGLAKELRALKLLPIDRQLSRALELDQLDIVKILASSEPNKHDLRILLDYKDRAWFKDVLLLFPEALVLAIDWGFIDLAEELIQANANLDLQVKNGYTALMLASRGGHTRIVDKLIQANANLDLQRPEAGDLDPEGGESALTLASENGHSEIVDKLIQANADLDLEDNNGDTALMLASNKGYTEIADKLIQAGAEK